MIGLTSGLSLTTRWAHHAEGVFFISRGFGVFECSTGIGFGIGLAGDAGLWLVYITGIGLIVLGGLGNKKRMLGPAIVCPTSFGI